MEVKGYTEAGSIEIRLDEQTLFVPDEPANRHRQLIAEWEAEGNTIPPYLPPTPEITLADYQRAIREHMDSVANEKDYDSAVTIATYATSTIPKFKTEADCFIAWRDRLFVYANAEMAKFFSGLRTQPSPEEFISELEVIQWPPVEESQDA